MSWIPKIPVSSTRYTLLYDMVNALEKIQQLPSARVNLAEGGLVC